MSNSSDNKEEKEKKDGSSKKAENKSDGIVIKKNQMIIAVIVVIILLAGGVLLGINWNNWFGGNSSGNSSKTNNAYQEALKDLKQKQREEENSWKELYANNKIIKEKYDEEMLKINMKYLERQVKLAGEYGQDETAVMSAWLDAQIAANDRAYAEMRVKAQRPASYFEENCDHVLWNNADQASFRKACRQLFKEITAHG